MANYFKENDDWRKRWIVIIAGALLLEVCILALFLLIWMINRGLPPTALLDIAGTPQYSQPLPAANATQVGGLLPAPTAGEGLAPAPTADTAAQPGLPFFPTLPPTQAGEPSQPAVRPTDTAPAPRLDLPLPGKIVYTCFDGEYDQICLMNADGSGMRQLTDEKATSYYPSLSPDGEVIAFSSRLDGNFEIYLMDTQGNNLTQLTNNLGNCYAPEISPKGNRIIFTLESGGSQAIWVMKTDGSNARPLVENGGGQFDPTWSPDALRVAFASNAGGVTTLWITDASGKKTYPLMREAMEIGGRSSWSPDGQWLAFYAGPRGDREIYIVAENGGSLQQLTDGGDNLAPSFSPDGQWLAFTSFRDGNNEIYVLRLADLRVFRVTSNNSSDWQPRWGP